MKPVDIIFDKLRDAVIEQESGGDAKAVSPVGAKGLMQLMDPTGKEWRRILGIKESYDPFDPEQNKRIGTAYLEWLLKHFDSVELALAAYNGGPGNLRKAIRKAKSFEWDVVKHHLFNRDGKYLQETADYVPKVLKIYSKICSA